MFNPYRSDTTFASPKSFISSRDLPIDSISTFSILSTALENFDQSDFIKDHNEFLSLYRTQQWEKALDHIKKYQSQIHEFHLYYDLFMQRISELKENPPENDWQGVFVADFK